MRIFSACDAAKPLVHSWPLSIHWWLSLTAADQGAWASGIGALVAALAALWVAYKPSRDKRNAELSFSAAVIPALISEAVIVRHRAKELKIGFLTAADDGHAALVAFARGSRLGYLALTHRLFDRLDWFTVEEGQAIAHVVARHAAVSEDLSAIGMFSDIDRLDVLIRGEEFDQAQTASINAHELEKALRHMQVLFAARTSG